MVIRGTPRSAVAFVEMKIITGENNVCGAIPHIELPCVGVPVSAKMGIRPEECKPVAQPLIPNRASFLQLPAGRYAEKIQQRRRDIDV
jgi:hypothetical protein